MTLHKKSISIRSIIPLLIVGISMTFSGFAQAQVTTYEHCNFDGKKADVPVGKYTWPNLLRDVPNLKDNDISSIKVSDGYTATLYADANYTGKKLVVTRDTICLADYQFNDTMSSIKVERNALNPSSGSAAGNTEYKFEHAQYFKKYENRAIPGYNDKQLTNVTPDQCMKACAESVSFLCRSFDYFKEEKKCDLSHATAKYVTDKDKPEEGLEYRSSFDYYENNMGFRRIKNAYLEGYNKKQLTNVSPAQCRSACTSESAFECKSFDYHKKTNKCDLSDTRGHYEVGAKHGIYASFLDKYNLKESNNTYDHYIRVRPDYITVQTPDYIRKKISNFQNDGVMKDGFRCKMDPWKFRANDDPEDDNTACSDPTGAIKASDKRDLNYACKRHDVCYAAPGSKRQSECDDGFGHDMYKICDDKYRTLSPDWNQCRIAATTMTGVVYDWGGPSWKGGQDWARKNCIKGEDK